MDSQSSILRTTNIPNKYELIIIAAKEARRLNELSRQTGLNLGGKVTNIAIEEALKGHVLYHYEDGSREPETEPLSTDEEE